MEGGGWPGPGGGGYLTQKSVISRGSTVHSARMGSIFHMES
jgi:hypothetical protein